MSKPSLPHKTTPAPNFFHEYSVVLPASLKDAYTTFGTADGHERVCRLFKHCSAFELLGKDEIEFPIPQYPDGKLLVDVAVRTASFSDKSDLGENAEAKGNSTIVTRQHFTMEETIPVLFGVFSSRVQLTGTLSWDAGGLASLSNPEPESASSQSQDEDKTLYALYESIGNAGIMVWKLRIFTREGNDPSKTRITERIEGWAPAWLRPIVQSETLKGHRAHMDLYHTLC